MDILQVLGRLHAQTKANLLMQSSVQSYRFRMTGLETGVHHGRSVTSNYRNLVYFYNDARVIKWMWKNLKLGFRDGVRSFEN